MFPKLSLDFSVQSLFVFRREPFRRFQNAAVQAKRREKRRRWWSSPKVRHVVVFFLVLLRHGPFQSHSFCRYTTTSMVKRFGCYEKLFQNYFKKRERKSDTHHFCAPSSSFKSFFLCISFSLRIEKGGGRRRARTGTSTIL